MTKSKRTEICQLSARSTLAHQLSPVLHAQLTTQGLAHTYRPCRFVDVILGRAKARPVNIIKAL